MRIRGRVLAYSSFAVLVVALAPTSALAATPGPACGHANLNNPGNHYGLIKNGCLNQPPPPPPTPTSQPPRLHPSPVPTHEPVSSGVTNIAKPIAQGIPDTSAHSDVAPAGVTPAPLSVTAPPLLGAPATANVPSAYENRWGLFALLGSALLLLLLAALGAIAYLRRRQQGTGTPAR